MRQLTELSHKSNEAMLIKLAGGNCEKDFNDFFDIEPDACFFLM